jgi:hypothetical protein
LAFDGGLCLRFPAGARAQVPQAGKDALKQQLDMEALARAFELGRQRRLDCAAALVPEHDEEGRVQVDRGVLQRAHDFRRDDVAGHPHDEELAEPRVEQQLGRHARIAAADERGVGLLTFREGGEDFLSHGREARPAAHEALVPRLEPRQCLVCRIHIRYVECRRRRCTQGLDQGPMAGAGGAP